MTTPNPSSPSWHGSALVITGAICFSTAVLFIRLVDGMSTLSIVFYRALFGWLLLALFITRWRAPLHIRRYRAHIPRLLLLGVIVTATVSLYTYAIQHTTVAVAVLLVNSAPVYVAALSPLVLKEPRAPLTGVSLALALTGMVLVSDPGSLSLEWDALDGVIAAALSGVTYALSMLISRGLRGGVGGLTQNLWSLGMIVLVLAPVGLSASAGEVIDNLPALIPLGIFSLGLSYLFYFMGLERVSAQRVSVLSLFEPVSGVMIGLVAFGEVPNALGWVGGALILSSMLLISRPTGPVRLRSAVTAQPVAYRDPPARE